jgi:multicomponent Na+:H+ antiporter subunit D
VVEAEWVGFWFALVVGALTLYSMVKLWLGMFATGAPAGDPAPARRPRKAAGLIVAAALLLGGVSVWIGLSPGPLWELSERAAAELLASHPEAAP